MRLIGRDSELAALAELVGRRRLITLVGQGGIGKTRLAAELAHKESGRYPGGVWWVELASAEQPSDVLAAWGHALNMPLRFKSDADQPVLDFLSRLDDSLVVVDNCEQVLDRVAALIERVLILCPCVSVLATSRSPLEIGGEVTWRVAPLSLPPADVDAQGIALEQYSATALFLERARQGEADRTFAAADGAAVQKICAMLDGNPFAIQLAAARSSALTIDELLRALSDSLDVLQLHSTRGPHRARSVTASIRWSVDLLDPRARTLLGRLSVFPSSFTAEAAAAVSDSSDTDSNDPRLPLTRLVDFGLIDFEPSSGRYRLLFTVRKFAAERLYEHHETARVRARHGRYWLERAIALTRWGNTFSPDKIIGAGADDLAGVAMGDGR